MILCVDIGNTATKLALVAGARVIRRAVIGADASEREAARACARVVRGARALEAAALSSVRPRATRSIVRAMVRACGVQPLVVGHRTPMPMEIAVRRPDRVGSDRLCAACGALGGARRHAVVVTVGTAVTVNLVRDRAFVGGVIMPGPAVSLAALHRYTERLPRLAPRAGSPGGIDDTEGAMRWGTVLACAAGARAAVAMLESRAGLRATRWVTGGQAGVIDRWLPAGWRRAPDLTLLGLARIARHAGNS